MLMRNHEALSGHGELGYPSIGLLSSPMALRTRRTSHFLLNLSLARSRAFLAHISSAILPRTKSSVSE